MALRDNLKSEKVKDRYDRNFNSVETTYSQKELEEHEKEIRANAIDEFAKRLHTLEFDNAYGVNVVLTPKEIDEIAEQLKGEK